MRQERFKMEREGLVTEGQEVEISERSAGDRTVYLPGRTIYCDVWNLSDQRANQGKNGDYSSD